MSFLDWRVRRSRVGFLFVIEHLVLTCKPGNAWDVLRYKNGMVRYFWTRKEAQFRADRLNRNRYG